MDIQQKTKHWKNIFEQQQSSGLSIIGFCRKNKINVSTFYGCENDSLAKLRKLNRNKSFPSLLMSHLLCSISTVLRWTPTGSYELSAVRDIVLVL